MDPRRAEAQSYLRILVRRLEALERHRGWQETCRLEPAIEASFAELKKSARAALFYLASRRPVSTDALARSIRSARGALVSVEEMLARLEQPGAPIAPKRPILS